MSRSDETRQQTVTLTTSAETFVERRQRGRTEAPALTILHHPDSRRVGERVVLSDLLQGREVQLSRLQPHFSQPDGRDFRSLDDPYVSRTPVVLRPAERSGGVSISAAPGRPQLKVDGKLLQEERELSPRRLRRGVVLELAGRVVLLLHGLTTDVASTGEVVGLVGESEGIRQVRQEIARVADLEVPVLLRGETGTGKELVARAIHEASRRRTREFLSLNMGAVPATLAASELFGAVKGAFTGSVRSQVGYFQRAHGGTLFLDEIGEAPSEVQVLLLRTLETGEIQRVGSQDPTHVDVRLLAATDMDLEEAIADGRFKAPLLHRLSGYELLIPPLRERRDDFGRLLYYFLRQELRAIGEEYLLKLASPSDRPWMPASIVARLARHPWPGNVRQLRNVARQLVIGSRGSETVQVTPQVERLLQEAVHRVTSSGTSWDRKGDTLPAIAVIGAPEMASAPQQKPRYRKPSEVKEGELLAALRAHRWEIKPTAVELGIARSSLYVLIDRCSKVRRAGDLSREEILACREKVGEDLEAMVDLLEVSSSGLVQRMKQLGIG